MTEGKKALRILRIKQVQERIGLSRSAIYDRIDPKSPRYDNTFPRKVKIGLSAVGFLEDGINEWIESRLSAQ